MSRPSPRISWHRRTGEGPTYYAHGEPLRNSRLQFRSACTRCNSSLYLPSRGTTCRIPNHFLYKRTGPTMSPTIHPRKIRQSSQPKNGLFNPVHRRGRWCAAAPLSLRRRSRTEGNHQLRPEPQQRKDVSLRASFFASCPLSEFLLTRPMLSRSQTTSSLPPRS